MKTNTKQLKIVGVPCSEQEQAHWRKAAGERNMTLARFIRTTLNELTGNDGAPANGKAAA